MARLSLVNQKQDIGAILVLSGFRVHIVGKV